MNAHQTQGNLLHADANKHLSQAAAYHAEIKALRRQIGQTGDIGRQGLLKRAIKAKTELSERHARAAARLA